MNFVGKYSTLQNLMSFGKHLQKNQIMVENGNDNKNLSANFKKVK